MAAPKIDDQYWFDYSKEMVDGAISRLDKAIDSLKTYIKGLLLTYTTAAIFTIEYKEIENIWLLVVFALPYVTVLFGEWFATSSTLPATTVFDYRVPTEIENAYQQTYNFKEGKLKTAVIISFVATVFVAIMLMLGFIIGNKNLAAKREEAKQKTEMAEKKKEFYLDGAFSKADGKLVLSGNFPPSAKMLVTLTFFSKTDTVVTNPHSRVNSQSGLYFEDFAVEPKYDKVMVDLKWKNATEDWSIHKVFPQQ